MSQFCQKLLVGNQAFAYLVGEFDIGPNENEARPVGWVAVLLGGLNSGHSVCQSSADPCPLEKRRVKGLHDQFDGGVRDRPQRHQDALSAGSKEGSGQGSQTVPSDFGVFPVSGVTGGQDDQLATVEFEGQDVGCRQEEL